MISTHVTTELGLPSPEFLEKKRAFYATRPPLKYNDKVIGFMTHCVEREGNLLLYADVEEEYAHLFAGQQMWHNTSKKTVEAYSPIC